MTVAYLDASALVKLVVEERGSEDVARLWDAVDSVLTSRVAHPEVRAALAAARRGARLDGTAYRHAKADWAEFHRALRLVELTPALEQEAGELAETYALSGFDAVHLASALAISALPVIVATWDVRLHRAAQASGLATLPGHL
jgi:uncharacterized protein